MNAQHTPALWVDNCQCEACVKRRKISAAAPELLEALIVTLKHWAPKALECEEWVISGNSQTDAILRSARAAIAKATNQ